METHKRLDRSHSTQKTRTHPSRKQSGERHGRDSSRRLAWLIPIAALVVAMAIAFTIKALDDYSTESASAELALTRLEEDAAQQHVAEIEAVEEAIEEGGDPRNNTEELDEKRREMSEELEELERLGVRKRRPRAARVGA